MAKVSMFLYRVFLGIVFILDLNSAIYRFSTGDIQLGIAYVCGMSLLIVCFIHTFSWCRIFERKYFVVFRRKVESDESVYEWHNLVHTSSKTGYELVMDIVNSVNEDYPDSFITSISKL